VHLTCKAADSRQFALFAHEAACTADDGSVHSRWLIAVTWGLLTYYEVIMRAGKWLTDDDCNRIRMAIYTVLLNFLALRAEAVQQGHTAMWKPKPKLHMIVHLVDDFIIPTKLNPRSVWCYGGEDFVGKMKKVAKSCHRSSVVLGLIQRYLLGKSIELADYKKEIA
jgi:hypothetical protein